MIVVTPARAIINDKFFYLIRYNVKLPLCQYRYETYFPKGIKFACNEPAIANGKFCIFHDKEHYTEYAQEATERFEQILSESVSDNKPLECFGYYLPGIDFAKLLKGRHFAQPVCFNEATFYNEANFSEVKFYKTVDFSHAKFLQSTSFSNTIFSQSAYFSHAT